MNEASQKNYAWVQHAFGRYLLDWEQQRCNEAVADIFGYHAVQLGGTMLNALAQNRMPHQWVAATSTDLTLEPTNYQDFLSPQIFCEPEALPFAESSIDLLVMPHTLEWCHDPHAALREAARVLVPEGKLLLFGLNPFSLWGLQHGLERGHAPTLNAWKGIAHWRIQDWLQVLALDIVAADFGCYAPALETPEWLDRWRWMDKVGSKVWPILGSAYCMLAVKKVHGMRLLEPSWRMHKAPRNTAAATACHPAPQRKEFE